MEKMPDFESARNYCVYRLAKELSPRLIYHNLDHTIREVVPATDRLAKLENIAPNDRMVLLTAAYFHDIGFVLERQGHEAVSIEIAKEELPKFGYSEGQLVVIQGIINATRIPQSPTNLLEKIMADADLDYLGQDNFWIRSNDLRNELENYGSRYSDLDWFLFQLNFIQAHQYFTESQRLSRDTKKQQHLIALQKRLKQISSMSKKW